MLGELMRLRWSTCAGTWQDHNDKPDRHYAEQRQLDPTVIKGIITCGKGPAWQGSWMVVEADESDGSSN